MKNHYSVPIIILFIFAFLIPSISYTREESFTGRVINVSDGDTIKVLREGNVQEKIRLFGVDSPEKKQAFGEKAREFAAERVAGKDVEVEVTGRDRYGRVLGVVRFDEERNLNRELVAEGMAWWYDAYSDDEAMGELEKRARVKKKGLWADGDPMAPWEFRRQGRQVNFPKKKVGDNEMGVLAKGSDSFQRAMAEKTVSRLSKKTIEAVLIVYGPEYCGSQQRQGLK